MEYGEGLILKNETSREGLLRALNFEPVSIIPVDSFYWRSQLSEVPFLEDKTIPEKKRRLLQDEMDINPRAVTMFFYHPPGKGDEVDHWGVRWERNIDVDHPIKDWDDLMHFKVPEIHRELFPDDEIAECRRDGKTVIFGGPWSNPTFEMYRTLRGFENCLTDPILYPDQCFDLIGRIEKYNLRVIKIWLELGCEIIGFADDLGTMKQTLISPELWRKFYKPSYKKYCDLIHGAGVKTWMHSDGAIAEIIPDLIEVGLDILDPVQAECIDINWLADICSNRMIVWGGMHSHLMGTGTYDTVRAHAEEAIDVFHGFEGGMVGTKSNYLLKSIDVALALYHAFRRSK